MARFITPIILIAIAVSVFFVLTDPIFNDISTQQKQIASLNTALDNSKTLGNQRDILTKKNNDMNTDDLNRLKTFLPSSVDNIRLILEIEQIAAPYGMSLRDVKYNVADVNPATGAAGGTVVQGGGVAKAPLKDYGTFNLEFSTSGSYDNFINFTKDLESNLRMVDISSVSFSSDTSVPGALTKIVSPEIYKYDFKIKTYWLKS